MNTKPQKKSCKKSGKLWDAFSVAIGVSKKPKKADTKDKTEKKLVATSAAKKPETVKKSETVKKPESVKKPATTTKKTDVEHGRKVRKATAPKPVVNKTVKAGTKKPVMKGCGCGK